MEIRLEQPSAAKGENANMADMSQRAVHTAEYGEKENGYNKFVPDMRPGRRRHLPYLHVLPTRAVPVACDEGGLGAAV
jgi:hypothetical protein